MVKAAALTITLRATERKSIAIKELICGLNLRLNAKQKD